MAAILRNTGVSVIGRPRSLSSSGRRHTDLAESARLGGPDRRTHCTELLRLSTRVLERRAGVRVYEVSLLNVGEPESHQLARVLSFQESSSNSPGPEVDVALGLLGHRPVDHDIGDLKPATRLQHALYLREHRVLVRDEVDHTVRDHDID